MVMPGDSGCFPACGQAAELQQPQLTWGEADPPASLNTSLHLQLALAHLLHPADPPSPPHLCSVCLCCPLLPLCRLPRPSALNPCLTAHPCCLCPCGPSPSAPADSPAFSWKSLGLHLSHQHSHALPMQPSSQSPHPQHLGLLLGSGVVLCLELVGTLWHPAAGMMAEGKRLCSLYHPSKGSEEVSSLHPAWDLGHVPAFIVEGDEMLQPCRAASLHLPSLC